MQAPSLDYYQYVEDLLRPDDVHEAHKVDDRGAGIAQALIFSIILAVVHTILLYVVISGAVGILLPLVVHIILSVLLLFWGVAQLRRGHDAPFLLLLALSTSFTGLFGALGTLIGIVLYGFFRQNAINFNDWFYLIFPQDRITAPEDVYNKIRVGIDENPRRYEVMPFLDVMELGSENQKRQALSKMTMKFSPKMAPALRRGLKDSSNAIRVQAATSVAKIESQFFDKIDKIERARKKEPENQYVLYALAKYYDDYAYTGLLGEERETLNREKAIQTYKAYLQQDPNNAAAWAAIGRLLFRSGRWQEAADWFGNAAERGWDLRPILLWYVECLYRLGEYAQLRSIIRSHGDLIAGNENLPKDIREAIALWTQPAQVIKDN